MTSDDMRGIKEVVDTFLQATEKGDYETCIPLVEERDYEPYQRYIVETHAKFLDINAGVSLIPQVAGAESIEEIAQMEPREFAARYYCQVFRRSVALGSPLELHSTVPMKTHVLACGVWRLKMQANDRILEVDHQFPMKQVDGSWQFYLRDILDSYMEQQESALQYCIKDAERDSQYLGGVERMPRVLKQLVDMEEEAADIGLYLSHYETSMTPPDVINIGHTGGEVHFGLLTDFGKTRDLSKAPVLSICPSDDPPIRFIAANLKDFLCLLLTAIDAERLANVDSETPEAEWLSEIEAESSEDPDEQQEVDAALAKLRKALSLEPIESVYEYMKDSLAERQERLACGTLDGIGILKPRKNWQGEVTQYEFSAEGARDVQNMKAYLEKANELEKLAFCRDAQYSCVLAPDFDSDVQELVSDVLAELGLSLESRRIRGLR